MRMFPRGIRSDFVILNKRKRITEITPSGTLALNDILRSKQILYKELHLLGYEAMRSDVSQPIFQRNILVSPASSWSKIKPSKKQHVASAIACWLLVSCSAFSSTLKIKESCSPKT
jgi:hypothetical protein